MATPRDEPFVWVTWLSALLSGATTCEWAVWFKAHYSFAKRPRDGDLAKYQIEHTALLAQVRDRFRSDGYVVSTERQNEFKLRGSVGVLAGRPDLVAVKDKLAWVIDVKTRSMKVSHRVQVMLYMWALPKAFPAYRGLRFDGRLVCPAGELDIPADEVDEPFVRRARDLLRQICGDKPPMASPSPGECRHCEITAEDCPVRMDGGESPEAETYEF
jgi:PD-(D/E)XK nuclease superfamily